MERVYIPADFAVLRSLMVKRRWRNLTFPQLPPNTIRLQNLAVRARHYHLHSPDMQYDLCLFKRDALIRESSCNTKLKCASRDYDLCFRP